MALTTTSRQQLASKARTGGILFMLGILCAATSLAGVNEPLPTLNDEADAYTAQGLAWSSSNHQLVFANTSDQDRFASAWYSSTDIHGDTEGDDLWMALAQYNRYNGIDQATADKWLERARALRNWMVSNLRSQVAADQNADHLYGWGLAKWIAERGPDAEALSVLNNVRSDLETNTNVYANETPGVDRVFVQGNAGRRWARWLRFAVALAEVDPSQRNITFRDKVTDLVTLDPRWSDYPYPGAGEMPWNSPTLTDAKGGDYASGDRTVILFHMGLLADSLWQARNAYAAEGDSSRVAKSEQRLLEMADFWMSIGREPGTGLHRESSGFNINTGAILRNGGYGTGRGVSNSGISGIYTISIVNNLVFAYKLTGDSSYLSEAWDIWKTWQSKVQGGRTGVIDHFADTIHQPGTPVMANNKGELQYVYALFEKGGTPTVIGNAEAPEPTTTPEPPTLLSDSADPVATVSLAASPSVIDSGQSTTLTWDSANVSDCVASGGWSGSRASSGSEVSDSLSSDTQFNLTCSSASGDTSDSVLVSVDEPVSSDTGQPSWLTSANDRTWIDMRVAVGASTFSANDPTKKYTNWDFGVAESGSDYHTAVIDNWNGGIARENFLVIALSGGHRGSSQNTIYEFGPFTSEKPDWHWYGTDDASYDVPSHKGGSTATIVDWEQERNRPYYSDGRPSASHTYDHQCYVPDLGNGQGNLLFSPFMTFVYSASDSSSASFDEAASVRFGLADKPGASYGTRGTYPDYPGPIGPGGLVEWDPVSRRVWIFSTGNGGVGGRPVFSFDPSSRSYAQHATNVSGSFGNDTRGGTIDPDRRIMAVNTDNGLLLIDLQSGNEGQSVFVENYAGGLAKRPDIGMEYEPVGQKFVGYDGGDTLYTLEAPANYRNSDGTLNPTAAWAWQAIVNASGGATPSARTANGTYGRFRYIPSIKALVVINDPSDSMYVYKIPTGGL